VDDSNSHPTVSCAQAFASTNEIAIVIVVVVLALATVVVVVAAYQWFQGTQNGDFLLRDTMLPPVLLLHKEHRYHLFLSHVSPFTETKKHSPTTDARANNNLHT